MNYKFSGLADGSRHYSWPCVNTRHCSNSFGGSLTSLGEFPHTHVLISILLNNWERPTVNLWSSFSAHFSLLWYSVFWALSVSMYPESWILLWNPLKFRVCQALSQFPFSLPWPGNSLKAVNWGNLRAHFVSHLSGITILLCPVSLKALLHIYFINFWVVSGGRINIVPAWLKAEVPSSLV